MLPFATWNANNSAFFSILEKRIVAGLGPLMTVRSGSKVAPPAPAASCPDPALLRRCIEKDACEVDKACRLFFVCVPDGCVLPHDTDEQVFFSVCAAHQSENRSKGSKRDEFVYQHFFADFGPLNMRHVHAFCKQLKEVLKGASTCERMKNEGDVERDDADNHCGITRPALYVCSSCHPHRRSNAAVLVLAYLVRGDREEEDARFETELLASCVVGCA